MSAKERVLAHHPHAEAYKQDSVNLKRGGISSWLRGQSTNIRDPVDRNLAMVRPRTKPGKMPQRNCPAISQAKNSPLYFSSQSIDPIAPLCVWLEWDDSSFHFFDRHPAPNPPHRRTNRRQRALLRPSSEWFLGSRTVAAFGWSPDCDHQRADARRSPATLDRSAVRGTRVPTPACSGRGAVGCGRE